MTQFDVTIAYLTIINEERSGWTGGLLVLNAAGRPLEFQCTLPVRPTRTHEILFGSTLRAHVIGETIAPLLVSKTRTPISLLCCDQIESMEVSRDVSFPIALVDQAAEVDEGPIEDDMMLGSQSFSLAGATLRVRFECVDPMPAIIDQLANLPDAVEPFERIREAIREAHAQVARGQRHPSAVGVSSGDSVAVGTSVGRAA